MIDLNHLGNKWLELKKQRMQNLLKIAPPDEALYREIMLSLGYPNNKVNFHQLALITPYYEIKKLKEDKIIEKALLFRAGFIDDNKDLPDDFDFSLKMDKSVWKYHGIRPANFPEKRIEGVSKFLSKTANVGLMKFFEKNIENETEKNDPKKSLKNIMNFEGIGIQRKEEIFFSIIMPFMMVFSKSEHIQNLLKFLFENHPPLFTNRVIRSFKQKYPSTRIENVKTYMGVLFHEK